jgi:hypothetical protein
MLRLLLNSITQEDKGLKHRIQGDAWFGSLCTANEVGILGHEFFFQVKQIQACFQQCLLKRQLRMLPEVYTLCWK